MKNSDWEDELKFLFEKIRTSDFYSLVPRDFIASNTSLMLHTYTYKNRLTGPCFDYLGETFFWTILYTIFDPLKASTGPKSDLGESASYTFLFVSIRSTKWTIDWLPGWNFFFHFPDSTLFTLRLILIN